MVEDNRRHAELISEELTDSGLVDGVESALTGADGLERLAAGSFDLVLLDYRLPDFDGLEFMRRMREHGFSTPVIFVTTADSVSLAVQAMKLGAQDFVQKQEGYLDVLPLIVREALHTQNLRKEKDRLEVQLRQSEKLASLGILASGLAHNINNRLTSLKTFFELAPLRRDDRYFLEDFTVTCREDLDKIALLVQELTRYAFSEEAPRPAQPLAELVSRALSYLSDQVERKQIRLRTRFVEVPPVPVDGEGIKQLVINLVKNAVQASPVGGEICVSVGTNGAESDPAVVLRVEDNGTGLASEIRERIFDPFFTTKDHGLGIGLYLCHKIVSMHRGRIGVEDRSGGGTVFTVTLPSGDPKPSTEALPGSR